MRESSLSGREEERSEPADTILQTVSIARGAHMVHVVPLCAHTHRGLLEAHLNLALIFLGVLQWPAEYNRVSVLKQ